MAAYVILGINTEGKKEVLSITVGDNESSKYWLSVLNELKNRGVKDILIICADGLSGIKEAIAAAFPKTEYQVNVMNEPIVVDKNIITSYSPQTANDVAFIMLERLLGTEKTDRVRKGMGW